MDRRCHRFRERCAYDVPSYLNAQEAYVAAQVATQEGGHQTEWHGVCGKAGTVDLGLVDPAYHARFKAVVEGINEEDLLGAKAAQVAGVGFGRWARGKDQDLGFSWDRPPGSVLFPQGRVRGELFAQLAGNSQAQSVIATELVPHADEGNVGVRKLLAQAMKGFPEQIRP